MTEEEIIKEFRLKKSEIGYICSLLQDSMSSLGFRSTDLSLEQKVRICLKTLGSGSFQNCSKNFINVSQPTVSQVFSDFTDNMVRMAPNFIYMPSNSNKILRTKKEFYKVAGFPGVIGCIDGSHIVIIAPHQDEFAYVNRKKFHSVNIQGICDANLVFLDVMAKWPGSCHDSFTEQASQVNDDFDQGKYGESWLLGDSGYPLKDWLMTPIPIPATSAERNFNVVHRKTRCFIERAFEVLKSRWRILDHTGGSLCYSSTKVAKIVITCCALHNMCRRNGTPILSANPPISPLEITEDEIRGQTNATSALRRRQRIVEMLQLAT